MMITASHPAKHTSTEYAPPYASMTAVYAFPGWIMTDLNRDAPQ
jgi:hypothetical protein